MSILLFLCSFALLWCGRLVLPFPSQLILGFWFLLSNFLLTRGCASVGFALWHLLALLSFQTFHLCPLFGCVLVFSRTAFYIIVMSIVEQPSSIISALFSTAIAIFNIHRNYSVSHSISIEAILSYRFKVVLKINYKITVLWRGIWHSFVDATVCTATSCIAWTTDIKYFWCMTLAQPSTLHYRLL